MNQQNMNTELQAIKDLITTNLLDGINRLIAYTKASNDRDTYFKAIILKSEYTLAKGQPVRDEKIAQFICMADEIGHARAPLIKSKDDAPKDKTLIDFVSAKVFILHKG